jgi:hypothetical protein
VRDRAAVGVGVDQEDLADQGGRFEGEVDGDGGAAGGAFGAPDGEQGVWGVVAGRRRDVGGLRGAGCGFGRQGGAGQVDEGGWRVGVGADVVKAELAEAAFAVLVAGGGDADHGEPGGGEPGEGVVVEPAGAGGDDGRFGLTGGRHGEQVAEVVATVEDLGGHRSGLAGLDEGGFPGGPGARGDQPDPHGVRVVGGGS